MFEWILLAVGIVGFGLAGYWDLKTTEFPDWLPYSIIIAALLVRGIWTLLTGDIWIFLDSAMVGTGLLAFGLLLYFVKQWGDGDAWLLGGLGYLFPVGAVLPMLRIAPASMPFYLILVFNFFFISFIYLVIYSVGIGVISAKVRKGFFKDLRGSYRAILIPFAALLAVCAGLVYYLSSVIGIPAQGLYLLMGFPFLLAAILVFVQYGKFVEETLFKKQISVSKLREGDVPVSSKWRTLSKEEVAKLKKRGGKIWIKEGVRLAPVFLITLIVTLFWGVLFL